MIHKLGNGKIACPRCSWMLPLPASCCWCENKREVYMDTIEKMLPCGPILGCSCNTCFKLTWPNDFKYYGESHEEASSIATPTKRKLTG